MSLNIDCASWSRFLEPRKFEEVIGPPSIDTSNHGSHSTVPRDTNAPIKMAEADNKERGGFGRGRGKRIYILAESMRTLSIHLFQQLFLIFLFIIITYFYQAERAEVVARAEAVDVAAEAEATETARIRTSGFLSPSLEDSSRRERSDPSRRSSFSLFLSRSTRSLTSSSALD